MAMLLMTRNVFIHFSWGHYPVHKCRECSEHLKLDWIQSMRSRTIVMKKCQMFSSYSSSPISTLFPCSPISSFNSNDYQYLYISHFRYGMLFTRIIVELYMCWVYSELYSVVHIIFSCCYAVANDHVLHTTDL